MFIKKLVLNGFKSFCDLQEITFVNGIAAIIGPNGCGKSNVVDAIKWVIGAQSTRDLRANSMTDVIFSGTEHRKGLGRAQVRLTLANENNVLSIDYNEVEISRTIYADGENEYHINKDKVRLKDIHNLFLDTGLGKSSYSVMAQGKIDQILSHKPEDRRFIIEEAAGITRFKVKRDDAVRRLKQADDNIVRIKDIIEEVKHQYEHMSEQAERALKFRELQDNEIKLEIELNLNRTIKQRETTEELKTKISETEQELLDTKQQLENLEDDVEGQLHSLTEFENEKIEVQREVFKIQSDIKVSNSKADIIKDQINQFNTHIKGDQEKINGFNNNLKDVDEELSNIDNLKLELDEKTESLGEDIDFHISNISMIEKEIMQTNRTIDHLKSNIANMNIEMKVKQDEQKKITDNLVVTIDQSLNVFDANAAEISTYKKNLGDDIEYILTNLPMRRAFLDDMVKVGQTPKDSEKFFKMLEDLNTELKKIEGRVESLDTNTRGYIEKTEEFLDDIFGPEGILQQKRAIENKIADLVEEMNADSEEIEEMRVDILKKREKKDEFSKTLNELNVNLASITEKKNSIDNDVKRLNDLKEHLVANKDELEQKIEYYVTKIHDCELELEDIKDSISELAEKKEELEEKLVNVDKKIKEENAKMSSHQKLIKETNDMWMEKKNEVQKLTVALAEAKTTITNIYDGFYENYSIDLAEYEDNPEYATGRNYNTVRKELNGVKSKKHSLGSVNLMAIEESKTLEERYTLLLEQLSDLEKAKKDIIEMIEKINKISSEMFTDTFKVIRKNFQELFKKLFDGGNADMQLTDMNDVLRTGIEIKAHPPGQKTQSITLLSGGQRTMTAIALMFATFLVKPSPFCLLDEIDAALDEENIRRFINLLQDFKDKSQFVIITHNSKTISAADVMYGVTQEQKGISKIVSAKFAEAESVTAPGN